MMAFGAERTDSSVNLGSAHETEKSYAKPHKWSQRSEFTTFNMLVLAPNVVSGELDVFPAER